MTQALITFQEVRELAKATAESRYYPGVQSAEQALVLMSLAQAEGMHPIQALQRYHVIEGKPSKQAQAMLADFIASGGKVEWLEHTAARCMAKFTHPQGGTITTGFTIEDAKRAGLAERPNWKRYPENMLHARCVSKGVRFCYPAATGGFHTPEEEADSFGDRAAENKGPSIWEKFPKQEAANEAPPPVPDAQFEDVAIAHEAPPSQQPQHLAMPDDTCDRVPAEIAQVSRKLTVTPFAEQDGETLARTVAERDALAKKAKEPQNRAVIAVVATFARAEQHKRGAA